jgi:hypothetical protein
LRISSLQLGGNCNHLIPTSSAWGLMILVALMTVAAVAVVGRRFARPAA